MRAPSYIKLEDIQQKALDEWAKSQRKPTIEQHDEMYGGATLTSSFVWTLRCDSVCDEIKVKNEMTGDVLDLTIDDDGVGVWTYKKP